MTKSGRPRRYDLRPVPGFVNDDAGYAVAALDELSARLCDMIGDLEQDALDFVPPGTTNSIAMLAVHMAWAEASWIVRVAQVPIDPDLEALLLPGKQGAGGELPVSTYSVDELTALCHRVRQEVTIPGLSVLDDIDLVVPDARRPMTVRGVLMHLIWHWTYHSGQVGLLRRQAGARYQWTFDNKVGDVPKTNEEG
jgi:uncharacterized damage-inducible protein DinB